MLSHASGATAWVHPMDRQATRVNEGSTNHSQRDRLVAPALIVAIFLLVTMFVVLYIALDPLLSDLTSTGTTSTETAIPAQETPVGSPEP